MIYEERIKELRKDLRLLKDWDITVSRDEIYKGQITTNPKKKKACLYEWEGNDEPEDFLVHEMLHLCIRSLFRSNDQYEDEEILIQDICRIIFPEKNKK